MKFKYLLTIIILITFILGGAIFFAYPQKTIKNNTPQDELRPLSVFGQANINLKVLDFKKTWNSVNINAKILRVNNYTTLKSGDTLLNEGEEITIHFSGVGNPDNWKTTLLSINSIINLNIRCLDGRINSKDTFTKESCYWEANEGDINIQ